jgi:hypothetical protein
VRGVQELRPELAGEVHIGSVPLRARDLVHGIDAEDGLAEDAVVGSIEGYSNGACTYRDRSRFRFTIL